MLVVVLMVLLGMINLGMINLVHQVGDWCCQKAFW